MSVSHGAMSTCPLLHAPLSSRITEDTDPPIFTGDQEEKPNLVGEEPSLFLKVQQ